MTTTEQLAALARAYVEELNAKRYSAAQYLLTEIVEVVRREQEETGGEK